MASVRHWPAAGRALAAWELLSAVGVAVIAVPDGGEPVVTLSDGHGPSAWDLFGVLVLLVLLGGWAWFLSAMWALRRCVPRPWALGVAAVAGLLLVAWSVLGDHGSWWILGAIAATAAQILAALGAARHTARYQETL